MTSQHLSPRYKGKGRPRKNDYLTGKERVLQTRLVLYILLIAFAIQGVSTFYTKSKNAFEGYKEVLEQRQALKNVCKELISPLPKKPLFDIQVQAEEVVTTPEPKNETEQIEAYIRLKFEDRADDALKMLRTCENSKLNPKISNKNRNGTIDRGVFQINSIHGGEEMFNWKTNIDKAHQIYKGHGNTFYAWSCGNVAGDYTYKMKLQGK